jgi:hypothetical protein
MKSPFFYLGLSFALIISNPAAILAIQSAPIQENSDVKWSQVVEDAFDGTIVYDRHFTDRFTFVSSWSKQGIRATYTQKDTVLLGYETIWESRWVSDGECDHPKKPDRDDDCKPRQRLESYPVQKPIYKTFRTDRVPRKILFAINGQLYTYENGNVSAKLASALSQAPDEAMRIRLEWDNGETTDMDIGKGTVRAWKTIFKPNR